MEENEIQDKIILLVEDNPDDEELTIRTLKKNVSAKIFVARDGIEALEFLFSKGKYKNSAAGSNPVLIILDINLPKLNGIDVLKKIRASERTKLLPVVMLTSSDEEKDLRDSYAAGANSYIRKHVDYTEFKQAIQNLVLYWIYYNKTPDYTAN